MSVQRQRGVALLVALLVVALATVLIASLLDSGQLALARTQNLVRGEQAAAYAHGLEAYAAKVLADDGNKGSDSNSDPWAVPLPPTPVLGGTISGTMRDMNGCFNLNDLVLDKQNKAVWRKRFRRLLTNLQLQPAIADAAAQWAGVTGDLDERRVGDGVYLGRTPAYRGAAAPFADVSELRLVMGVDAHTYAVLRPYVCALPTKTSLNLNTASVPVLMSLSSKMTQSMAANLYSDGHANWGSRTAALNALQGNGRAGGIVIDPAHQVGLGVRSDYFMARGHIELDGIDFTYRSLIQRNAGIRVLWRRMGGDG